MQSRIWRDALVMVVSSVFVFSAAVLVRSNALSGQEKTVISKKEAASANAAEAYRYNTLGVAYMNQQRPADAQKYFEQALAADPKFAVARLNLGVAFLGQQKPEQARAALAEAAEQLPKDRYAWYNLGL